MEHVRDSTRDLRLLSKLLLAAPSSSSAIPASISSAGEEAHRISTLGEPELVNLESLAVSNHVVLRAFESLQPMLEAAGNNRAAEWIAKSIERERARINHALEFLTQICGALEDGGCRVIVIKSLDHWPDLGSDLDLYTNAQGTDVIKVMRSRFGAKLADRSWGDRLANKWNFIVPGLPELVEVHAGRLGQTGEQTVVTQSLTGRSLVIQIGAHLFRVPTPEDRIVISTLQRMYRHFYVRLCDVVDNAALLDSHSVDFSYLRSLGLSTGLWDGIATYLSIISEYVAAYRGYGTPLASSVTRSAKFGTHQMWFQRQFLRVPILPQSLKLYATELKSLLLSGELRSTLRLSLLPCLATAAALEQKLTGSDKGIW